MATIALPADEGRQISLSAPTDAKSRIRSLDVLRGFALLGILLLNIDEFYGPEALHDIPVGAAKAAFVGWHANLDFAIVTLKWLFAEGKMRGMFAMLFGAGCVLLTERLERGGRAADAADIFLRRSMWLALFGLLHGTLIWYGDILLDYALCALLFLYPFRHVAVKKLLILGALVWLVGGTIGAVTFLDMPSVLSADRLYHAALTDQQASRPLTADEAKAIADHRQEERAAPKQMEDALRDGRAPYLQALGARAAGFIDFVIRNFRTGLIFEVVGPMLFGMGLYKSGFLIGRKPVRTYLTVAILGYCISAPLILLGMWKLSQNQYSVAAAMRWLYLPYELTQAPAVLANASVLLIVMQKDWFRSMTNSLAAVGRMALSNYIMTSLVCQWLFSWGPLKLYGALEYYQQLYVVAGVWALNICFSRVWLSAFSFGPLEWVWRSLTYWHVQPLRNRRTPQPVGA